MKPITRAGTGRRQTLCAQRGAALLIMLLILVLGVSALFTRSLLSQRADARRASTSTQLLAEAKEALLGYAATRDATHPGQLGFLPCPDIDNLGGLPEGEAHEALCGLPGRNVLGRLPWRTLGIEPGRSQGADCLWYAVSGSWKAAGIASPTMLNEDSNGQFRIRAADGTTVIAGAVPAERPVALLIAPGPPLPGQVRATLPAGVGQCGGNFLPGNYLDDDTAAGIDNGTLASLADAIDDFITAGDGNPSVNDRILTITRAEIQERITRRADVQAKLAGLAQAVAKCVADHGKHNAGGPDDRRLPWPAPVGLPDYRSTVQYNDTPIGALSGRLPDLVNDSNSRTGNPDPTLLTGCNSAAVPEWTPAMATLWQNWKDHLFYAVARDFRPDAPPASACTQCLEVNGTGAWAAIVMFSGSRLPALGQVRDQPPMDADTRDDIANYLEGRNAGNHPNTSGTGDYQSGAATSTFNDVLYCIDANLGVSPC